MLEIDGITKHRLTHTAKEDVKLRTSCGKYFIQFWIEIESDRSRGGFAAVNECEAKSLENLGNSENSSKRLELELKLELFSKGLTSFHTRTF
jgi:hypothetical protein